MFTIATLYHFTALENLPALQLRWKKYMAQQHVTGTLLVAPEGINGTLAGPEVGIHNTLAMLAKELGIATPNTKFSRSDVNPFPKLKVRLKRETIPLGVAVNPTQAGTYVNSQQWNELMANTATITIDTRNDYEVKIGQFKGAKNPQTRTFKQLPAWLAKNLPQDKSTPIAMYCTGGIRCEKSTAYLKQQGYQNVYHLQGGILKYLEEMPQHNSLWQGDCYVFDDRVAVTHSLAPAAHYQICKSCNTPVNAADFKRQQGNICSACAAAQPA